MLLTVLNDLDVPYLAWDRLLSYYYKLLIHSVPPVPKLMKRRPMGSILSCCRFVLIKMNQILINSLSADPHCSLPSNDDHPQWDKKTVPRAKGACPTCINWRTISLPDPLTGLITKSQCLPCHPLLHGIFSIFISISPSPAPGSHGTAESLSMIASLIKLDHAPFLNFPL